MRRGIAWRAALVCTACSLLLPLTLTAAAEPPYDSLNYSESTGEFRVTQAPAPYLPERTVSAADLGCTLVEPSDLVKGPDGRLYIVDAGGNAVHRLTADFQLEATFSAFGPDGTDTFKEPRGMFVTADGRMYVADAGNRRLVVLHEDGTLDRLIEAPESELFPEGYVFSPQKIVVDTAGRIYLVVKDDSNGVMELDEQGDFVGYIGSSPVQFDPVQLLWKQLMTEEQREKMVLFLPIEYANLHLDEDGFLFAVSQSMSEKKPVKRLNGSGKDILNADFTLQMNSSGYNDQYMDVTTDAVGNYTLLDKNNGRLITYNSDGQHLYTFGALGNRVGTFRAPAAVVSAEDKLLVLDSVMANITVFSMTEYARLIREGGLLYNQGKYAESRETWEQVIRLNSNFEFAYTQIGRALCWEERYEEAMAYFKKGNYRGSEVFESDGYNKAFTEYRSQLLTRYMPVILTAVIVLAAVCAVIGIVRRVRRNVRSFFEQH